MKRNAEENYGRAMQSKRFMSPSISNQHYHPQSQQSAQLMSPYPFYPYPGNLMYPSPPQWSNQSNRYGVPTNLPPPPATPPPQQPPPPPSNNSNENNTPVFDLTQPPPPLRNNLTTLTNSNSNSNLIPSTNNSLNQTRFESQTLRGRPINFRGMQNRQRAPHNARNNLSNNVRQNNFQNGNVDDVEGKRMLINKKSRRKPMSARHMRTKEWDRADAEKALELENTYNKMQNTPMLIIKFPDPDLNKHIVKKYCSNIETVHFQQPSTPRYCYVTLKKGTDIEKVRKELCEIPFGTGKIVAEQKCTSYEESQPVTAEEIDPYTLYIGNLPTKVCAKTVKEHFASAARIDIGYAQRMKYTRYAFIRYNNVEDAMEAYKRTFNTLIGNRSLIVRFRRSNGNIGLPGETKLPNPQKQIKESSKIEDNLSNDLNIEPKDPKSLSEPTKSNIKNNNDILVDNENEIVINSNDDEDEEEEEEDSKEHVLVEARKIKSSILQDLNKSEKNIAIKEEPEDEYDNHFNLSQGKRNPRTSVFSCGLLGSRIKEEPLDDDALLACATSYNMEDYDDDEPEEEDDYPETRDELNSEEKIKTKSPILNLNENNRRLNSFDDFDVKPDLNNLPPIPYSRSNFENNQNRYEYSRTGKSSFSTRIQQSSNRKSDRNYGFHQSQENEEDEDDIFNDLNADDDFDAIGEF